MIRSSKIHFREVVNAEKAAKLDSFLAEYRRVAKFYLDELWDNGVEYNGKVFSIKDDRLNVPQFLSKTATPFIATSLSARALKCCLTQILGVISSVTQKRRTALWIKDKREANGQFLYPSLLATLELKITKPYITDLKPELNSICTDFKEVSGKFDGFLSLKSIGKSFGKIKIPIRYHRQLLKWKSGKLKNSFLISETYVVFRYELIRPLKTKGTIVGADTGLKSVVTLSDGSFTPKQDLHGHSLESIINKLSRKKRGSAAFRRVQEHRKNFIHWSINQLNLRDIKQINLENVVNINFGKRASRKMQAWTNTVIRDKVISLAEEREVLVVLKDSAYKSQRCSECGLVKKSNRKGETYTCKHCGSIMNADLNAARNHAVELPEIPLDVFKSKKNLKGFFWNLSGFEDFGTEFTVPASEKKG